MPNGHSFQMTGHIVQTNNESFRTDGPDARGTGELAEALSDEARQSKSPFVIPAAAEAERSHAHARPGGCECLRASMRTATKPRRWTLAPLSPCIG